MMVEPTPEITKAELVYIHGMGFKPPKQELKYLWDYCLFDGHKNPEIAPSPLTDMAYYADLRDVKMTIHPGVMQELVDKAQDTAMQAFTEYVIHDVYTYFYDKQRQSLMRSRMTELLDFHKPRIVLAHSLGTCIAYDALMSANHEVEAFITLGSPLGLEFVKAHQRLIHKLQKLVIPPTVKNWHNFFDPEDPVSLNQALEKSYKDQYGQGVLDNIIRNPDNKPGYTPTAAHSGEGYLSHPRVRALIGDLLT